MQDLETRTHSLSRRRLIRGLMLGAAGNLLRASDPAPASLTGTCTLCHDAPNVGHHSVPLAINIGVTDHPALPALEGPRETARRDRAPRPGRGGA